MASFIISPQLYFSSLATIYRRLSIIRINQSIIPPNLQDWLILTFLIKVLYVSVNNLKFTQTCKNSFPAIELTICHSVETPFITIKYSEDILTESALDLIGDDKNDGFTAGNIIW